MNDIIKKCRAILSKNIEKRKQAVVLLSEYFQCSTKEIYYKYQKGEFPQKGKITDKIFFFFHGLGCTVKNEEEGWSVSLEFGANGHATAIDAGTILLVSKLHLEMHTRA